MIGLSIESFVGLYMTTAELHTKLRKIAENYADGHFHVHPTERVCSHYLCQLSVI